MAGHFFSRGFRKCPRNCCSIISGSRSANTSRSKLKGSFQRKIHTSSKRRLPTLSVFSYQHVTAKGFPVAQSSILYNVQASGLHMTCVSSVSNGDAAGIISVEGEGETLVDPVLDNTIASNDISMVSPFDTAQELSPFDTAQDILTSGIAEPAFSSIGLGGYTPIGLIQHALEFAHINLGLPWWGAIVCGTILFRTLVFPLMIKGQVNSAKMNVIKPELERLQQKLREVANLQNPTQQAAVSMELQQLFQKHDCHPVKAIIAPLVQLPLFVSFFIGIRRMSYLPVESLKTGGIFWFPDLAMADPYFILPLMCAGTMWLTIETGADVGMGNPNMQTMKNVFRGMCVLMVPLTYTFPTAIFVYWLTSNVYSLGQVFLMKQKAVKSYFGLPDVIIPPPDPNVKSGSFLDNLKAGFKNAKEAAYVKEAEKMKELKHKSSMKDVYQETFEYNPKVEQNEKLFQQAKKTRSK